MTCAHTGCTNPAQGDSKFCIQHANQKSPKFKFKDLIERFYSVAFAVSSLIVLILGGWSENYFLSQFDIAFSQYADLTDYARVALKNFFYSLWLLFLFCITIFVFSVIIIFVVAIGVLVASFVRRISGKHHILSTFKSFSSWIRGHPGLKRSYGFAYLSLPLLLIIALFGSAVFVIHTKDTSVAAIAECVTRTKADQECHNGNGFSADKGLSYYLTSGVWSEDYPLVTVHLGGTRTTSLSRERSHPESFLSEGTASNMIRLGKAGGNTLFFDVEQEEPVVIPQGRILSLVFWPEKTKEENAKPAPDGGEDKIAELLESVKTVGIQFDDLEMDTEEFLRQLAESKGEQALIENVAASVGHVKTSIEAVKRSLNGFSERQDELFDLTTKIRLDIAGKPEECLDDEVITSVYFRPGSPTTAVPDRYAAGERQQDEVIKEELEEVVRRFDPNSAPKQIVALIGYADFTGDRSKNFELSYRRANLVANYLVEESRASGKPIARKDIKIIGTGEVFSVASDNDNADEDFLSRRVDMFVCDTGPTES